jgi:riboflavin kinase / FMN adenylyltransferase
VEIIHGLEHLKKSPAYPVATLGNFDGLHRGHQVLIRQVVERAHAQKGASMVLTFEPHPMKVLQPHLDLKLLASFDEKASLLKEMGVNQIICIPFTQAFSLLSPEEFVRELLCQRLEVREVVVGEDFAFGKNRIGTFKDLQWLGGQLGFKVFSIGTVTLDEKAVSSSRIRELIMAGHVKEAARLLGRLYSLEGGVIPGSRRGTTIGFPTANLKLPRDRVIPADGVYAAWGVLDRKLEKGVAYIGTQPTLGPQERTIELHLFESHPGLYGEKLRVGFQKYLREEKVFASREELIKQIREDIQQAMNFLDSEPRREMLTLED